MLKTDKMSFIRLECLKEDAKKVLKFLGESECFEVQHCKSASSPLPSSSSPLSTSIEDKPSLIEDKKKIGAEGKINVGKEEEDEGIKDKEICGRLKGIVKFFNLKEVEEGEKCLESASSEDRKEAFAIIKECEGVSDAFIKDNRKVEELHSIYNNIAALIKENTPISRVEAGSNLVLYAGKINKEGGKEEVKEKLSSDCYLLTLKEEDLIVVVALKKDRFIVEKTLQETLFVTVNIEKKSSLVMLKLQEELEKDIKRIEERLKESEAERQKVSMEIDKRVQRLIKKFTLNTQIKEVEETFPSTVLITTITGWIPRKEEEKIKEGLLKLTEGRVRLLSFSPLEVPTLFNKDKDAVKPPTKTCHRGFVKSFERMVFSYGVPAYNNIDPVPFVSIFFTLLFSIMFADTGQGFIFLLLGVLMALKKVKLGGYEKFPYIFIGIGAASMLTGVVTGEAFGMENLLKPLSYAITGLFTSSPHHPILRIMPDGSASSLTVIFALFGATIALGVLINSIGLVINFINNLQNKRLGDAFFGKIGLSGAIFFWSTLIFALRVAFFSHAPSIVDYAIIALFLLLSAFSAPLVKILNKDRGEGESIGTVIINGIVELIDIISYYLSNTISFVRVGAFALSHAVLGFIINMMVLKCGGIGGAVVFIIGNAIVVVLEGMIVAIQIVRLQYYEFFSKFFAKTGHKFCPLTFTYKKD